MNLFEYQLNGVKKLVDSIGYKLDQYEVAKKRNRETTSTVHFISPTGSGKTLMSFALMDELSKEYDNLAFLWLAPNKLHEQTLEKFEDYAIEMYSNLKPLDGDNIHSDNIINNNEILCLNWSSIDKDTNLLIKANESEKYMEKIISNTKENGSNIIVFIDESHIASSNESSKANAFIESINPTLRVEITATPKNIKLDDEQITIERQDVIDSGAIKKEFIFNDFKNNQEAINKELLTQYAYNRLQDIKNQFLSIDINYINPLMIIQIENEKEDEFRKAQYEIESYLDKLGISKDNIAYYMSKNKEQSENLSANNSPIQIVFTKTAIATGWDCPRASVLLTFRKSNNDDFKTQVLGRINRMPELKHYGLELLDTAYVYANMENYVPDKLILKQYNIKTNKDKNLNKIYIKEEYLDKLQLNQYQKQTIIDTFYESEYNLDDFVRQSCEDFWSSIKSKEISQVTSKIIYNLHLKDPTIEITNTNSLDIEYILSNKEVEEIFYRKLKTSGFKIFNSGFTQGSLFDINIEITPYETDKLLKTLKETSRGIVETYLHLYQIILQEDNFIYFSELLEKIITQSYKKRFKSVNKETIFENAKEFNLWKPPHYFECRKEIKQNNNSKNIYKNLCINDYNNTEQYFAYILDNDSNVDFWYKNGDKGALYFSIPYKKDNIIKNFYPDFIVKYKDGDYGIFDTKSEMTGSIIEAKEKAEYLYTYCDFTKVKGGLIKLKKLPTNHGKFIINKREVYTDYDPNNTEWEDFSISFDMNKAILS